MTARPRRRRRHGLAWRLALLAALLLVAMAAAGGALLWRSLARPYAGWQGPHVLVELPRGLPAEAMLDRLEEAKVLRRAAPLRLYLRVAGGASSLHAGEYLFDRPLSPLQVLRKLQAGEVLLHGVTIPEGLDLMQIARRVSAAGFGTFPDVLAAFRDPTPIRDLDPAATDLEGYLFPDTYFFARRETPARIAAAMVERFRRTTGADYPQRAAALGLTLREAVVLASLVEEETSVPAERARISRVFHNRLERGMLLQCDPTVLYALVRAGHRVGTLSTRHLRFASPWNTYVHPGLPPGPICSPGLASLEAAVAPADGADLFFVAAPGGGHAFSSTLAAHNAAVAAWRSYVRSSR